MANHQGPPIYLHFHEFSMEELWKALHLGVKECLIFPAQKEQLQDAVNWLDAWTKTSRGKVNLGIKGRPHVQTTLARVKGSADQKMVLGSFDGQVLQRRQSMQVFRSPEPLSLVWRRWVPVAESHGFNEESRVAWRRGNSAFLWIRPLCREGPTYRIISRPVRGEEFSGRVAS